MGSIMDYLTLDTMDCTTARKDENGKLRWHKHKAKIINGMEIHIYTSEEKCLEAGGHCWKQHPRMPIRACKHCGHVQKGTRQPAVVWEDKEEASTEKPRKSGESWDIRVHHDYCPANWWMLSKPDTFPLTEEECLDIGGHCWETTGFCISLTEDYERWCKHCGHDQVGRTQPEIIWEDVEEKEAP